MSVTTGARDDDGAAEDAPPALLPDGALDARALDPLAPCAREDDDPATTVPEEPPDEEEEEDDDDDDEDEDEEDDDDEDDDDEDDEDDAPPDVEPPSVRRTAPPSVESSTVEPVHATPNTNRPSPTTRAGRFMMPSRFRRRTILPHPPIAR